MSCGSRRRHNCGACCYVRGAYRGGGPVQRHRCLAGVFCTPLAARTDTRVCSPAGSLSEMPLEHPVLTLATADAVFAGLPDDLQAWFAPLPGATAAHVVHVQRPNLEQQCAFLADIVVRAAQAPPGVFLNGVYHRRRPSPPPEPLPLAPPPPKRPMTAEEEREVAREASSAQRQLRIYLRHVLYRLLAERRFKCFAKPVAPEEAPDYAQIVHNPMDLGTMLQRVDDRCYTSLRPFWADLDLIVSNAILYNPPWDSEQVVHRARAMHDVALSLIDDIPSEVKRRCEEIEERSRREPQQSPIRPDDEPVRLSLRLRGIEASEEPLPAPRQKRSRLDPETDERPLHDTGGPRDAPVPADSLHVVDPGAGSGPPPRPEGDSPSAQPPVEADAPMPADVTPAVPAAAVPSTPPPFVCDEAAVRALDRELSTRYMGLTVGQLMHFRSAALRLVRAHRHAFDRSELLRQLATLIAAMHVQGPAT